MGEKMICVERHGIGARVVLDGKGEDLLLASSAVAQSLMEVMCRAAPGYEKECAELVIDATKRGIEGYLRKNAGGNLIGEL